MLKCKSYFGVIGLSCEPLLGPIDINVAGLTEDEILFLLDWVIVGGESGYKARPMHPNWARQLRDQCVAAGTSFFFKQWGEWTPMSEFSSKTAGGRVEKRDEFKSKRFEDRTEMLKTGRKKSPRYLDGQEWNEYPEILCPF